MLVFRKILRTYLMDDLLQRCPRCNVAGMETWIQSWTFLLHMTTLLYSENQYKSQQQRFCSLRWLGFSRIANTSFFSQHRPLDTLESTALTTPNTLKQVFEAKHFSIADSILRSRCCPLQRGFTVQYSDAYLRSPHDSRPNSL